MKTSVFALLLCMLLLGCNSNKKETPKEDEYQPAKEVTIDPIERGGYLVNAIGCHDCHSPKIFSEKGMELDHNRLLSGHPADDALPDYDKETASKYILFSMGLTSATGPWGTSFAANLTPDETGIGTWTETQFLTVFKKGLYKGLEGSRPILPPMPWDQYRNLNDDDLKAIFAYLKSIKPVKNLVPAPIPPQMN
ncbi:diheme cytochrome c-553 [Aestuariivivens insulae]|uniref:diheme cytochrome c-553 n=1 Tax=Aestuariivivens insulae TaxID=1621988 RepID=UPI001F5693E9|nr:diheme cytochrome c-553 [Aestuariivivens insulae]